ncbi:MAG: glycosyltransferase family 9 protein [Phycisphaera sp.]|nr:glycosyltransferase family 9 protein [Phycisphaera sp.]
MQTEFADAVRAHPALGETVAFPRSELRGWWRSPGGWKLLGGFLGSIRHRYDVVVDAQGLGRSGFMSLASGAGRRVGYADAREFGWLGLTERVSVSPSLSAVDRMLELLRGAKIDPICDLRLHVPADAEDGWVDWKRREIGDAPFVALAPTSRWRSKEWPSDRWIELARRMIAAGRVVVVLGGPNERSRFDGLEAIGSAVRVLAGDGPLAWSMAAVRDAELVVANDSAMLHAAVGFERPLLGLFGPTDPRLCGPYGRIADCIRAEGVPSEIHYRDRRLDDRLMKRISIDRVVEACLVRLESESGASS